MHAGAEFPRRPRSHRAASVITPASPICPAWVLAFEIQPEHSRIPATILPRNEAHRPIATTPVHQGTATGGAGGGQGGAGGDGYFGGGGGGGGSSIGTPQESGVDPGGAGGGGSSYIEPGAGAKQIQVASSGETPEIVISWTKLTLPSVSTVSPSKGPSSGGAVVTITGSNLARAKLVRFGVALAKIDEVVTASELKVTAPKGSGTVAVTVTVPGGASAKRPADSYTY